MFVQMQLPLRVGLRCAQLAVGVFEHVLEGIYGGKIERRRLLAASGCAAD